MSTRSRVRITCATCEQTGDALVTGHGLVCEYCETVNRARGEHDMSDDRTETEIRLALARHLDRIASEMTAMLQTWGSASGEILGDDYPERWLSLDEEAAEVWAAAERIRQAVELPSVTLPSGNVISGETWGWMREAGTWHGYLDGRMYPAADRDWMDRELSQGARS